MTTVPAPIHRRIHRQASGLLVALLASGVSEAASLRVRVAGAAGDAVVAVYAAAVAPATSGADTAVIDQVDKQFVPRLLSVTTGTAVSFPNSDDIRHHVYSFSPAKTFELPLYHGVPSEPVVFDRAGKVILGCNIHDRMSAHVFVVDTPWHGVTVDGRIEFDGLPGGAYRVALFHPRHEGADALLERELALPAAGTIELALAAELPAAPPARADALTPLERKFRELRRAQE